MKKFIYCMFLKRKAESQKFQIYPGKIGKYIYENISKEAWIKWQLKQTIIINEKKLNTMCISHHKILEKEMINFFFKNY